MVGSTMKSEIKIPAMGESISEATIGTILKPTGSQVRVDDELLELETDKVNQVLYAQQEGVVTLTVKQGDTVKIGQTIGYVETEGKAKPAKKVAKAPKEVLATPKEPPAVPKEIPAAPVVKTLPAVAARQTKETFIADLISPPAVAPKSQPQVISRSSDRTETRRKMSKVRKVIAQRLVEVQHTTAMLTTFNEVDMGQIMALREKYKDSFTKEVRSQAWFHVILREGLCGGYAGVSRLQLIYRWR